MLKRDICRGDVQIIWFNHLNRWCSPSLAVIRFPSAESLVGIIRNGLFHYIEDS